LRNGQIYFAFDDFVIWFSTKNSNLGCLLEKIKLSGNIVYYTGFGRFVPIQIGFVVGEKTRPELGGARPATWSWQISAFKKPILVGKIANSDYN